MEKLTAMQALNKPKRHEDTQSLIVVYLESIKTLVKIQNNLHATVIPTYILRDGGIEVVYPESYNKKIMEINNIIEHVSKMILKY